jgi:hypothetical protein
VTDAKLRDTDTSPPEDEQLWQEEEYQAVSGLAVLAVGLSLLASAAIFWPTFRALWAIGPVAILVSLLALRRIAYLAPALVGRKAALVALALSIVFTVAAPTRWAVHRMLVREESRRFCDMWFGYLREDEPQKAHLFTMEPGRRRPMDDTLVDAYLGSDQLRKALDEFANDPLIRPLLALGPKAQVRHYDTEAHETAWDRDVVAEVYAVTYEDAGKRHTFFLRLFIERKYNPTNDQTHWMIRHANGGIIPTAYPDKPGGAENGEGENGESEVKA